MKRFVIGLVEGLVVGGIVAALVMRIFPSPATALAAYLGAVFTGAGTGLVAGHPIWAKEAKLEGLLKAVVGAFVASTALFGVRKWLGGVTLNLGGFGSGSIGDLPVVTLPTIGVLLSWVFEIDHAVGPEVSADPEHRRVEASHDEEDEAGDSERRRRHGA